MSRSEHEMRQLDQEYGRVEDRKQERASAKREAAHTPGPWEIDRTEKYYKPCVRVNGVIIANLPDTSAGLMREYDREEARARDEANARLIRAAPEMLEALEGLLPFLPDRNDAKDYAATNDGQAGTWHLRALQARAAIQKARGDVSVVQTVEANQQAYEKALQLSVETGAPFVDPVPNRHPKGKLPTYGDRGAK